jgi:3-oxoacyl-[acyl-carrier protein] reductase
MLLERKNAVVYGAGGAIGSAVARAFAREGANVFLAGRTLARLDRVARRIRAGGGVAEAAQLDALDERAVNAHAEAVVRKAGRLDVSFNAIGIRGDLQGTPVVEMTTESFAVPIVFGTTTCFVTARAAARQMLERKSGTILMLTASASRLSGPFMGGFGVACAAIEAFSRSLAGELGPHNVRVLCLRSEGIPETWADEFETGVVGNWDPTGDPRKLRTRAEFQAFLEGKTLLRRLPTLAELANVAAFVASDRASAMTATVANLTCGGVVD